jgi:ABC-type oligopeptide transport system substrate-binding subunit
MKKKRFMFAVFCLLLVGVSLFMAGCSSAKSKLIGKWGYPDAEHYGFEFTSKDLDGYYGGLVSYRIEGNHIIVAAATVYGAEMRETWADSFEFPDKDTLIVKGGKFDPEGETFKRFK